MILSSCCKAEHTVEDRDRAQVAAYTTKCAIIRGTRSLSLVPNERRRCQVKTALTFLLVYTLCWQGPGMGRKKGWGKVEDGNKKVTSPKFTQQPPHPCSSLESRCLGLNEGPGGIVGTLPQRAQGYWDWSGEVWGTRRGICVFVCRCGSGFCLCYWSSFWKVKHLGRAAGVTVGGRWLWVTFSWMFVRTCFVL